MLFILCEGRRDIFELPGGSVVWKLECNKFPLQEIVSRSIAGPFIPK